jgi:hypothetical protein
MQAQVLSLLSELCKNTTATAYYHAWKSRTHLSATQMLLRMYKEEENRLGVSRTPDGIIQNLSRPLHEHFSMELPYNKLLHDDDDLGNDCSDVLGHMK